MFAESVRGRLVGRTIGPARWYPPILSVPLEEGKTAEYLVVILGNPGPFCYLSSVEPLENVSAALCFRPLAGGAVLGVDRPANERILRLVARSSGEVGETLSLNLMLFGSVGRAELLRGNDVVIQFIGGRRAAKPTGGRERGQQKESERPGHRSRSRPRPEVGAAESSRIYLISRGRLGLVAPAAVDELQAEHRLGPFGDAAEACRAAGTLLLADACDLIVRSRLKPIVRRTASQRRLLVKLQGELERADGHQRVRREAETLAAYQSQILPGTKTIEIPDLYDPETTVRIDLDPAVPLRAQIDKRFKRAARLERSLGHTRRRIEEVRREIAALEDGMSVVESADAFAAAINEVDKLLRRVPGPGATAPRTGSRGADVVGAAYRRFDLDETWFVLVGRSNRENDELTFHVAAPADLWFHAQHVPGSHVVLKSRGTPGYPPGRILERAASVAAYFSKAKHSGLVPVIYTRRKYVRKPRGAKPGQVVCEREKTLMVEPILPPARP
jgi:hypothetical protein